MKVRVNGEECATHIEEVPQDLFVVRGWGEIVSEEFLGNVVSESSEVKAFCDPFCEG